MSFAQNTQAENKIDRVFRILIAEEKAADSAARKKAATATKTRCKNQSPGTRVQKKYDCIVYTTHPEALREKGILIRSELPAFVTASATLQQIMQMAAMAAVTYVEAPEILKVHGR